MDSYRGKLYQLDISHSIPTQKFLVPFVTQILALENLVCLTKKTFKLSRY